jgi:RNA polymerase sigma-70 factor (ECF subfamily)
VRDDLDAVGRALAELTADQREAIELRFFGGLSAREAAEVMGKQEGTVRGLQFRAIASLRRTLGMDLDIEERVEGLLPNVGDTHG